MSELGTWMVGYHRVLYEDPTTGTQDGPDTVVDYVIAAYGDPEWVVALELLYTDGVSPQDAAARTIARHQERHPDQDELAYQRRAEG